MILDEFFMQRALDLAVLGEGNVAPNPLVGCVITQNNKIIGEGYHQKYGEAHAEVNAINSVLDKNLLKNSTFYVSLEPCSHFGKTAPCADLLIKYAPKKVVICNLDTNPLVAGKGVEKLKNAGIEVISGILETEGRFINRRFFTFMEEKRPYIFLKWAQTNDGFLAQTNNLNDTNNIIQNSHNKQISNPHTRPYTHKWRTHEAAIMVGTNTAKVDNPRLDARFWVGNNPIRIFIDKNLSINAKSHLLDQKIPTLCYNFLKNETKDNLIFVRLEENRENKSNDFLENILEDLYKRKILSVMVEGGTTLLNAFLEKDIWDEIVVFQSEKQFFEGIKAPKLNISPSKIIPIQKDNLLHYFKNK